MATKFIAGDVTDAPAWELWRWDIDFRRATFYTPFEPYLRREWTVTATRADRFREIEAEAERRARSEGYVTFPELSAEAQEHWAEHDANWLMTSILNHIAERNDG